jgi:hypothetical protein
MSDLYLLQLKDGEEPKTGGYHEAFVVNSETERKAWGYAQRAVDGPFDDPKDWLKSAKKVECTLLGAAAEDIPLGVLLPSYIGG